MRHIALRSALLLGSALAASPAMAESADSAAADAQPERSYLPAEIVVSGEREGYGNEDGSSATKTPTPLIDVPQGVSFITEDQLEDQSIRQLNDALRYVPGVSMESGKATVTKCSFAARNRPPISTSMACATMRNITARSTISNASRC